MRVFVNRPYRLLQISRFAAVGIINTGIDVLLFLMLTRLTSIPPITASAISFMTGTLNSFLMNKHWTFDAAGAGTEMVRQYVKFILISLVVMALHQACLLVFHYGLGFPDVSAKGIGIILGVGMGFVVNKYWVFNLQPNPVKTNQF